MTRTLLQTHSADQKVDGVRAGHFRASFYGQPRLLDSKQFMGRFLGLLLGVHLAASFLVFVFLVHPVSLRSGAKPRDEQPRVVPAPAGN